MTNNTTSKKPTARENLNTLLALSEVQANADLVAYVTNELAKLDKKNAASKTIKDADALLMNAIMNVLRNAEKPMRVTEICQVGGFIDESYSSNKITSMVTKLVSAGKVNKIVDKRNSTFAIVEGATDVEVKA